MYLKIICKYLTEKVLTSTTIVDIISFKYFETQTREKKGIVTMQTIYKNKKYSLSTISYLISGIILLAVLGLIISSLVLSITGIILFVVGLIISLLIISAIIISIIQIIDKLIKSKTMTGTSKQILSLQRVEVGVNP